MMDIVGNVIVVEVHPVSAPVRSAHGPVWVKLIEHQRGNDQRVRRLAEYTIVTPVRARARPCTVVARGELELTGEVNVGGIGCGSPLLHLIKYDRTTRVACAAKVLAGAEGASSVAEGGAPLM